MLGNNPTGQSMDCRAHTKSPAHITEKKLREADDSEFDQQLGKAFGLSLGCLVQSGSKHLEPLIEFMCGKAK